MKKNYNLKSKLGKYAAAAVAVGAVSESEAAIIYTDETPDFAGGVGSQYMLDVDNDGTDDFRIYHDSSSNLFIAPLGANNEVLGSATSSSFAYPFALSAGAAISSGGSSWFNNGFSSGYQSLNYGSSGSYGNFVSVTDKFIGLRFDIGGNIHYGWVRLDVNGDGSVFAIKDYAYDDVIGAPINAGDGIPLAITATPATNIVGTDIANNSNGLDLEITMDASADETTLSEYRLMVVKSANVGTFDLTAAQAVAMADYTSVTPNSSPTYSATLTGASTDVDGDAIIIDEPYRVFVLNIADGTNAQTDTVTMAMTDVTLNTPADIATAITGTDIANNLDGTDAQIDFTAASDETTVMEYRIMIVKDVNAGTFDLTAAQAVAMANYTAVAPTGSATYTEVLAAAATDVDGDPVANNVDYVAFVLSTQNGTTSNLDDLSVGSSTFMLQNTIGIDENGLTDIKAFNFNDLLTVEVGNSYENNLKAVLLNAEGKLISEHNMNSGTNTINLSAISSGVYIIRIMNNAGHAFTQKFVK